MHWYNPKIMRVEDVPAPSTDEEAFNVYNRLKQQQIQPWIRVRNHADHGEFNEYTSTDVAEMIHGVKGFLGDFLQ